MTLDRIARACAMSVALLVSACYPALDWREVTSASGGYAVLMPAQPDHAQREIALGGLVVVMSMASVRRDGMAFGVAYADLPADYARHAEFLAAARDGLVRNIDGRITSAHEVTIDGAAGQEFYAEGNLGGRSMRLVARLLLAGSRFYQVVFVGQSDRFTDADVDLFLGSFRLTRK
ncbi:MAG: hypothetical protein LJE97_08255 [Betaproteobacteria bacterium]|jgi:hypothetical protein|nr:hypothetical protein [Betaproteobacteria bacterium]